MPKRVNRLKAINHEISQLDMIRDLKPNTTPPDGLALSDQLIRIAQEALREVATLETGKDPELKRLQQLIELVDSLPEKAKS